MENSLVIAEVDLVRIDSLPQVEEFFSSMYEPVRAKLNEIMAAPCTEENRIEVEHMRTEVRKLKANVTTALKSAEKELYEPWQRVKDRATLITKMCDSADVELKGKIEAIKDAQKKIMEDDLRDYFSEKCASLNIDWLDYDRLNIRIRLNDSFTGLRKTVDAFLERVSSDSAVILTLEDAAEVMAEYKRTLDLHIAIYTIAERKKAVEKEKKALGKAAEIAEQRNEHVKSFEEAVEREKTPEVIFAPPTVKQSTDTSTASESRIMTMTFTVSGTLEQLKDLKKYMIENNIKIH
jgi:hypothetical protein